METDQNKQADKKTSPDLSGFDFNSLLSNQSLMELLKHLLSGAGAMAGNYFLWIKPMQEKMDKMTDKIQDQQNQIRELEKLIKDIKSSHEEKIERKRYKFSRDGQELENDSQNSGQNYYFEVDSRNHNMQSPSRLKGLKI